ncbi:MULTISPECIES: MATE family efflux transporter [unclassified Colwellia]|uniref:MATE family efflux transporter n=1 Tax=unclassified Colwellia TaxID=196834 RepID=UPI0015F48C0A|nr:MULTISPECIES: MATE family efflux transporter [unclassified Colwellia]MBA6349819.1 MATE family efflux transporter [Colwellia sp. BRX8-9]MBA6353727.1 MATE family efflux transporter [Colwellia sp. BRX9-1]MBA6357794.1 MATE family efflux transporter [Colwellia sp. BRX8-3]MBA6361588.1 MATE family efflux transporter [Colwellia sp. BRX8-6]MBA6369630.1 MATE family efflux transporter [Colwellia sp. BRX8-5]
MRNIEPSSLKQSIKLAWPISLQSILVTMLGMSDIMMVGHLGDTAVASVGLGNRIQFVFLIILAGLASGVGTLSAQHFGAGQIGVIRQVIVKTLVIAAGILLPILLITFLFSDNIMGIATTDPSVIKAGTNYLWLTMPSLIFVVIVMIFENALRGLGQVVFPMLISTIAIITNIILNYWLIKGGLGIEPMGVIGAALATLIARALHALLILVYLAKVKHSIFPTTFFCVSFYNKQEWTKLLTLVWPMMLSFGVWSLGTFVYQLIYGRIGTQELAVMSLLAPMEGLLVSFFFGFASACAILVGQRLGRNEFITAWVLAKYYAISAPIVTFLLALILLQCESLVFMPYSNLSPETMALSHDVFVLITFGTCLKVFNLTMSMGILRAGGDNKYCMLIDISGMWILSIPLTLAAAFYFKLPLYWVVLISYSEEITKAFMFVFRMRTKLWLKNLTAESVA